MYLIALHYFLLMHQKAKHPLCSRITGQSLVCAWCNSLKAVSRTLVGSCDIQVLSAALFLSVWERWVSRLHESVSTNAAFCVSTCPLSLLEDYVRCGAVQDSLSFHCATACCYHNPTAVCLQHVCPWKPHIAQFTLLHLFALRLVTSIACNWNDPKVKALGWASMHVCTCTDSSDGNAWLCFCFLALSPTCECARALSTIRTAVVLSCTLNK